MSVRFMHFRLGTKESSTLYTRRIIHVIWALLLLSGTAASAATTVGVRRAVNCPGAYLPSESTKVCQAAPDYKDIIYLGEKSRKSCKYPYTRVNAGKSKWCVTYPDPQF